MRFHSTALLAATVLVFGALGAHAEPLALGAQAPSRDVSMKSVDGRAVTIASAAGRKGTLVIFTCNACPWAKAWQSRIALLGNDAIARGIGVIAINSNDPEVQAEDGYDEMQRRAKQLGLRFPYVVDATSEVARAYGATRTPEVFLFDAQDVLVYRGTVDDNAKQPARVKNRWLKDAVTAVAGGRKVKTAETKALGCSIKFRGGSAS